MANRPSSVIAQNYSQINPINLPGFDHIYNYRIWWRYLEAQYKRHWKVHFAKKTRGAWRNVKYIGRYLKRPPISAAKL
ncbi:MAG: transposase [Candidatus Phlomobacter fragariae]